MKKLFSGLLAIAMCASITGCGTGDSGGFAAGFALRHEKGRIPGPVHSKLFNAHGGSAVLLAWRPVHTSVRSLAGMAAHKRIQQRPALYPAGGNDRACKHGRNPQAYKERSPGCIQRKICDDSLRQRTSEKDSDDKACAAQCSDTGNNSGIHVYTLADLRSRSN